MRRRALPCGSWYDEIIPMAKAAKIAITLDADLLAEAERLRTRTAESRSAVFARALRMMLQVEKRDAEVARYLEAYAEQPETDGDVEAARQLARAALSRVRWDEP